MTLGKSKPLGLVRLRPCNPKKSAGFTSMMFDASATTEFFLGSCNETIVKL
ncbi:MAG: hypothetical protein ACI9WS_000331 [Paraglaciecola psychrophila]|jgi:hypothetical protein